MTGRLAEDHANAKFFGQQIADITGLTVNMETVQTNMLYVDVADLGIDAKTYADYLHKRGVRGLPYQVAGIRFATYRGIERKGVDRAAMIIRRMEAERP